MVSDPTTMPIAGRADELAEESSQLLDLFDLDTFDDIAVLGADRALARLRMEPI